MKWKKYWIPLLIHSVLAKKERKQFFMLVFLLACLLVDLLLKFQSIWYYLVEVCGCLDLGQDFNL